MAKRKRSINKIIHNELINNISLEDKERLHEWLNASHVNKAEYDSFMKERRLTEKYKMYAGLDEDQAWKKFQRKHFAVRYFNWKRMIPYAAILFIPLIIVAAWFLSLKETDLAPGLTSEVRAVMAKSEQVGKKKATLVLPNGQKVKLQSMAKQPLHQSSSPIIHSVDTLPVVEPPLVTNNRLMTHEDSEYWMVFEDGTTVHLNYNTTLMYPPHFSAVSRTVYLDGEAYFQVAKDSERPFRVVTRDGVVKQYGTSFNVNTYAGCTKVVLVEGSVSVVPNDGDEQMIHPGQLAVLHTDMPEAKISKVDIEPYVAWNSGRFVFDHCSLESLMDVMAGWYNKEVVFESDDIKQMRFTGDVDRYGSVVPIMKAIQRVTGLEIEVDEKTIMIRNK